MSFSFFSHPKKILVLSSAIILLSIAVNITGNRIKIKHLKEDETLVLNISRDLPEGEYYLEYYIACSSSGGSSAMELKLVDDNDNGYEILYDKTSYATARGFGISTFKISDVSNISACFKGIKKTDKSTVWAGIGDVYIKSSDGGYQELLYCPNTFGKRPEPISVTIYQAENIQLSDFAMLIDYTQNGKALELNILCDKETAAAYDLGLKISCNNINALSDGEINRFYRLTPETSSWEKGRVYTQTINLNLNPGDYFIEAALSPISDDTTGNIKNYQFMDIKDKAAIGGVRIKAGQSFAEFLNTVTENQVVIISIMDDGVNALNEMSLFELSRLGIKSELKGKNRWSYIAVAARGVDGFIPLEKLEQERIDVQLPKGSQLGDFELPFELNVTSAGYAVGSTSSIVIDCVEYSARRRGMNIVVYDLDERKVVSSVNFDTYITNYN